MPVFTRESLSSGDFLKGLDLPAGMLWTKEQLEHSLAETMRTRPPGELWVFAYGSLLWNPLLNFDARQVAVLEGWHRSFCLQLTGGRGSPERPGRMLAVEPGGVTQGVALRFHEDQLAEELRVLWTREMLTGAYLPIWTKVSMVDGSTASAVTFAANPSCQQYDGDASVQTIAPFVATAAGFLGTNAQYVYDLDKALKQDGLSDEYITNLVSEMHKLHGPVSVNPSVAIVPDSQWQPVAK